MADEHSTEAQRLEALWAGQFGDEYVERNDGPLCHSRGVR